MQTPLRLLAAGLLLCLPASLARAEGSKQLTPNTNPAVALTDPANTRAGFLTHDVVLSAQENISLGFLKPTAWGTTAFPFTEDYRMFVRLKPGETMHYGVHRNTYDTNNTYADLVLTVRYGAGDGTIVKQTTLNRDQSSADQALLDTNQDGVIATAAEVQAGPRALAGATGYRALTYTNTTGGTQDFFVEFTQVGEYTSTGTQGTFNDLKTKAAFGGEARSEYDFWDFTVVGTDGLEKPGRLFSRFWSFTTGLSAGGNAYLNRLSATFKLFPLVESMQNPGQYYVKEVELAGMRPLVFFYVTNAFGSSPINSATDFPTRRKSQTTNTTYAQYPNFVNNPDESIWPSAPIPTVSVTPQPFCNNGKTQVAFTTRSAEAGQFDILIDLNGTTGYQAGTTDVLLTQSVAAGTSNTVVWNGIDGQGNLVAPSNQEIKFEFTSNGAAFNFPVYDAEGNPDGFRVRNVRPANGSVYDRLYWDDSNLPTGKFPAPQTELAGQVPGTALSAGVHKWGATNDDGNQYTVNTWTYGFSAFNGATSFIFTNVCDNDGDGISDDVDLDDDNDGILDVVEAFSALNGNNTISQAVDPGDIPSVTTARPNPPIRYLDAAYVHPVFGAFRDVNNDGVNDIFDTDMDGIPNHFDLDSDDDGIPDAIEANGNKEPTYARGSGANRSQYSATESRYVGNVGTNGLPNAVETDNNDSGLLRNALVQNADDDNDNDRVQLGTGATRILGRNYNFLDLDSDNDGITDEVEAQTTAAYTARKSQANFNTDTNQNGIRDAYDPSNGGTAMGTPINSDGANEADMFDFDSDSDNAGKETLPIYQQTADWTEGFDTNQNGTAGEEIMAKARAFAAANPAKANYYVVTTNGGGHGGTTQSVFLQDSDADGIPNFLDTNSSYYHDDNFNGLVDLYDPAYGGAPSTAPMNDANTEALFRFSGTAVPLPVTLLSFRAQASGHDALVTWATAQEVNSANFVVERSANGVEFTAVATLAGRGTSTQRADYHFLDRNAGAQAGIRYYRLRQNDTDGKFAYSGISVVTFDGKGTRGPVSLSPNPATAAVTLDLSTLPAGTYRVEILGAEGRKVAEFPARGGEQNPISTQALAKGVYLLRISGNDVRQTLKLVKE